MSDAVLYALKVTLGMDASEFLTGRSAIQRDLQSLRDGLASFGEGWMRTGKRLTIGITAPLAAFGVASAKAASDAAELGSAFNQTFGGLSGDMQDWAEATGDAMGRSTQSMMKMANTFGIFFNQAAPTRQEAAAMSKTFAVLAQDLGSFYNVSEDEALQKLRSGLAGESEPLRDFGVFLTEASVASKALEMGLAATSKELTEQDKILARYNLILEGTRNAQGDVGRTADGTANQMRAFWTAIDELRVVIGEKLLPILTPIVTRVTAMVNSFNGLPAPIQNVIIAIGAFAAALGPMMLVTGTLAATLLPLFAAKFGPIGIAISAFINPLGTAISLLAQFAVRVAGMAILESIGGLLLRFLGPVGLLVTAGTLIYQNWGKIGPMLESFWKVAQVTLGPPLQELATTISGLFAELWQGPLGEGLRAAMDLVKQFGAVAGDVLGTVVIAILKQLLTAVTDIFLMIADALRAVNALLKGDFAGAWDFAVKVVKRFFAPFTGLAQMAVEAMAALYTGVKAWLQDKLGKVLDWVRERAAAVGTAFYDLYIAVVGNSYVPDMVTEIGQEFNRLQTLMVDPAQRAAEDTKEAFRQMASDVSGLLDRLFPQFAEARRQAEELKLLDDAAGAGLISDDLRRRARLRVLGSDKKVAVSDGLLNEGPLAEVEKIKDATDKIAREMAGLGDKTEVQTVRVAETFQQMADRALGALRRLSDGIKGGDFFSILEGVIGIGTMLGQFGLFGKKVQANLQSTPGFANGGAMRLGGFGGIDRNILSLNGTPIARVSAGETMEIRNANQNGGPRGGTTVVNNYYTLPSDEFWGRVDGRAAGIAAPIAQATTARAFERARASQGKALA